MDTHSTERRLHPLMVAAALSIIVFCGVGVAAISGLIPQVHGQTDKNGKASTSTSSTAAAETAAVAPVCHDCGSVIAVNSVIVQGDSKGVGAVGGAVVGGVVGHQFGNGSGKKAMTALGAIGGAVAGNAIEKNQRQSTRYDVVVRMEDGRQRTISANTPPPFSKGDKVRLASDGSLLRAD